MSMLSPSSLKSYGGSHYFDPECLGSQKNKLDAIFMLSVKNKFHTELESEFENNVLFGLKPS